MIKKDYAFYKGDRFIDVGSIKYLSQKYKIKEKTLHYYHSPAHQRRSKKNALILIAIEEDL